MVVKHCVGLAGSYLVDFLDLQETLAEIQVTVDHRCVGDI